MIINFFYFLLTIIRKITFCIQKYVPGHKGVLGNEVADRLAKEAIILEKIEKLKIKLKTSD